MLCDSFLYGDNDSGGCAIWHILPFFIIKMAKIAIIAVKCGKCQQKLLTLKDKTKISTLRRNDNDHSYSWGSGFVDRHPVIANMLIIMVISMLGIYAAYLTIALFTKHGRTLTVPHVENMSYTEAVNKLHGSGLKVDIRDSLYREDVCPGFVIEQFPKAKSVVKPGRKIFLYINAVHPKEVIIDDDNHPTEYALKGVSYRSAKAKLEELGFKNIRMVRVLGASDRVVKILANGNAIRKMQKVPVNAQVTMEISDGRLNDLQDSLRNAELMDIYGDNQTTQYPEEDISGNNEEVSASPVYEAPQEPETEPDEGNEQYF